MAFHYSPKVVTDGLVLYLDAANPTSYVSGSLNWNDLSRSQLSGSLINGPTFSSANNGSIVFDGVNDYVLSSPPLVGITDITIIVWFKSLSIDSEQVLYDCNYVTNGCLLEIYQSKPSFQINTNYIQSTTTLLSNQIYCVAVSKPNSGAGSFYVNAVNAGSTITSNFNIPNSTVRLGTTTTTLYPFKGSIYNAQIYNRALSAQEVLQNYNATKGRFGLT